MARSTSCQRPAVNRQAACWPAPSATGSSTETSWTLSVRKPLDLATRGPRTRTKSRNAWQLLNVKELRLGLTDDEEVERAQLRAVFPTSANTTSRA